MKNIPVHQSIMPLAVGLALALGPSLSWSASLGEMHVFSAAADPLRAEIPLQATVAESAVITARIASPEIFRSLGIDYRPSLKDLSLSIARRGEQSAVIIRSSRPIEDPELRIVVEIAWSAGQQIREYVLRTGGAVRAAAARSEIPVTADSSPSVPDAPVALGNERVVQSGETLRRIAEERRYSRVSMEQMLLGLFKANPDAFVDQNINRLKSGAILNVPEEAFVAAIPEGEARQFYLSHIGDWSGYRRGLAAAAQGMAVPREAAGRESSGKIEPQDRTLVVPDDKLGRDQLKVDVVQPGAKNHPKDKASAIADRVAQEKALMDARERLAVLEKNVEELQRLLQLRNADLAAMQQSAAGNGALLGEEGWFSWLRTQLANPVVAALSAALLAVLGLLAWLFGRSRPTALGAVSGTDEVGSPPVLEPSTAGGEVPEQKFDMTKISLDLSAKPVDDSASLWKDVPRT